MLFINPNGDYPRHIGDIQIDYPDYRPGDSLPEGWKEVAYAENWPTVGKYEVIYETEPTLINGKLTQNFQIRPMTPDEKEEVDAPQRAKEKLIALGFTETEIRAIARYL